MQFPDLILTGFLTNGISAELVGKVQCDTLLYYSYSFAFDIVSVFPPRGSQLCTSPHVLCGVRY